MKTHIVVVIDESGSMSGLATDVVGGYNQLLSDQQAVGMPGDTWTLVQFDQRRDAPTCRIKHDHVALADVPKMRPGDYVPHGSTPLYDAVGESIRTHQKRLKRKDRVICIINTDGHENASREFTLAGVKALVQECEAAGNWTFVWAGVGLDNIADVAASMGSAYAGSNTRVYTASAAGVGASYATASAGINAMRGSAALSSAAFMQAAGALTADELAALKRKAAEARA